MFGHTSTGSLVFLESGAEADLYRRARRHASQPLVDVGVDAAAPIDYPTLIQRWLRRSTPYGLEASARALLAERAGIHQRDVDPILAGHSRRERERWVAEHAADGPGRAAVWLCDCALGLAGFDVCLAPLDPGRLLAVGVELVGRCSPIILLDAGGGPEPDACRAAAALAGTIRRDAPGLPLAIASSRPAMGAYLETTPESAAKAEIRHSVAAWSTGDDGADGFDPTSGRGRAGPPAGPGTGRGTAPGLGRAGEGRSDPVVRVPVDALTVGPLVTRRGPDDEARNRAERLLLRALEADHRTMGRFEPRGQPDVEIGGRPAQVDLLSRHHRLAVELDGHRHVTDAEVYRRARHKDLQLQLGGWVVLRLLVDDTTADTVGAVDLIAAALAGLPRGDTPHGPA